MRNEEDSANTEAKRTAAAHACELLDDGMFIGLGTGSTIKMFAEGIEKLVNEGMNLVCVPTSYSTELVCSELGIPTTTLLQCPLLDIAFDGACAGGGREQACPRAEPASAA